MADGALMTKRLLFLGALLLAACDSPTVPEPAANAYDFRLSAPQLEVLRWPTGATVHVFATGDADANRSQWLRDAVAFGTRAWNDALLFGEVRLQVVSAPSEADVVVQYSPGDSPVDASDCPPSGGLAFTTFCLAEDSVHLAVFPLRESAGGRVKFLVTVRASSATDAQNVRRLVTHELGHTLGIAQHSLAATDLMYWGTLSRDTPSPADRATLQVLYHTPPDITP